MKINENEKISIWLAGNTGLRNPMRIQEGFTAFARSPFVGNLHGRDNELGFMAFLDKAGIINNVAGKDSSGSHARKWRLMFERYGLIYGQIKGKTFTQADLGPMDEITPFGRTFLRADTVPSMQECFLRSLSVEQYELPDKSGLFSPFRWILAIMLELEKRTGSSELSRLEFGLYGHTTNPLYDISDVVEHILDLRNRRNLSSAKRVFDKQEIQKRGQFYDKMASNFMDYCDMNMRYLRISGILQRKGRGLMIVPSKHVIAEKLASTTSCKDELLEQLRKLTTGAPLPTDNTVVAMQVLNDLIKQMKDRHMVVDISDMPLETPADINNARAKLEEQISKTDEINYAALQSDKWEEIADYMGLLIKGGGKIEYDEDNVIEVPKEELAVYLEWVLWRSMLAIDHLKNKPYEVRGFRVDSDFMPVSVAGGGRGDLYCEFDNCLILTEVTMSSSSRQEAMEGEPVRRHVSDAVASYSKPVFGLFIAVRVDTNTAETFRHGVWYAGNEQQRLNIVPLSLAQYQRFFIKMFKSKQNHPEKILDLIDRCAMYRDMMEAPAWKNHIDKMVDLGPYGGRTYSYDLPPNMVAETPVQYGYYPHGLYFGSKIKDTRKGLVGVVTSVMDNSIMVTFPPRDGETHPYTVPIGHEFFEKGFAKLV